MPKMSKTAIIIINPTRRTRIDHNVPALDHIVPVVDRTEPVLNRTEQVLNLNVLNFT